MEQNYCQFQSEYYEQTRGLAMGNPLSPLLAEIFMDNLENIISTHPSFKYCVYWFRYVDDILVCFKGTERQLKSLHNYINTIHLNITFTTEIEVNKTINFLDLTISHNNNNIHEFAIYHKPTHTDTTIHARSFHPITHKLSAYESMIHRLINIPMSKDNFELEKNRILTIALNNGYSTDMVNNILTKQQKSKILSLIYPRTQKTPNNYNLITYIGNISDKIGTIIKKSKKSNNQAIAFKTNNSIQNSIKNNKDKTDKKSKSGVYKLTCEDCKKVYIGQTGRSFETRIKEHERSYNAKKTDSTFSNHCLESNHSFNNKFEILHVQNKSKKLNLLESLEINKFNKLGIILNDQIDVNNSPLLNLKLKHNTPPS